MIGQLFCDICCPASQRIALGEVKEETDRFNGVAVTTPGYTVTISTMLRDVVAIDKHCVATLRCGHRGPPFLWEFTRVGSDGRWTDRARRWSGGVQGVMSKRDTSTTTDIWFASVLQYSGYELCSIVETNGGCEYRFQCPSLDFEDLDTAYRNGALPLTDAKAFVNAFHSLTQRQKDYRRRNETGYTNPRWVNGDIG